MASFLTERELAAVDDDAFANFLLANSALSSELLERAREIRWGGTWQFGLFACATGSLDLQQFSQILHEQVASGASFCESALRCGPLTADELMSLIGQYAELRPTMTEVLAMMKSVDQEKLRELRATFARECGDSPAEHWE